MSMGTFIYRDDHMAMMMTMEFLWNWNIKDKGLWYAIGGWFFCFWILFISALKYKTYILCHHISQLSNLVKISPSSAKVTSANFLRTTKPYTNSWQTSRISPNMEFFYVRNSFNYFWICSTLALVLPKVQVPIVCGWQNHIPTVSKLQD